MAVVDLTPEMVRKKVAKASGAGWPVPKWVQFSRLLLENGFELKLCEARTTFSKYLYVGRPGSSRDERFKVRFSDHKPNYRQQNIGDSDFYVGHSNGCITFTEDAIHAVAEFFGVTIEVPTELTKAHYLAQRKETPWQDDPSRMSRPIPTPS